MERWTGIFVLWHGIVHRDVQIVVEYSGAILEDQILGRCSMFLITSLLQNDD